MNHNKDFRLFGHHGCEWGDWEENAFFDDPNDRNGAIVYFDAWDKSSALQFRIWHIDKDLEINLKGDGFKIENRSIKHYPDQFDDGKDCSSYLTSIVFQITEHEGSVEVDIPSEERIGDECKIRWDNQYIYDLDNRKAHFDIKAVDHYEIKEILTIKQRQKFALSDRIFKLKMIAKKMNRHDLVWQIDMARIHGDFERW